MAKSLTAALLFVLAVPAAAQWTNSTQRDQITGDESWYAISPRVTATEPMGFPYTGTQAWLAIGCNTSSVWTYIGFSQTPNLVGTDTQNGYDTFRTRARWDEVVVTEQLQQDWGSSFIHFRDDPGVLQHIRQDNSLLVEIPWYGEGQTYFRFSLAGASRAMSQMGCEQALEQASPTTALPGPEGAYFVGDPVAMTYSSLSQPCARRIADRTGAVFFADARAAENLGYRRSVTCR